MSLRVTAAVAACKLVRIVARVLKKGGTAKPGEIALKICTDLLSVVSRGVETVDVTGNNGKTMRIDVATGALEPVLGYAYQVRGMTIYDYKPTGFSLMFR